MSLKENYAKTSDTEEEKINKTVISSEAYAICEFLEKLHNKLTGALKNG